MTKNRDDFLEGTKRKIGQRAGWLCSYPGCRVSTEGATADVNGRISVGTASHICAAAPGGPRYDEKMSSDERRSVTNGIWMCRNHGTAIDSTDSKFTVEVLLSWKRQAEAESRERVLSGTTLFAPTETGGVADIRAAAAADFEVLRRTSRWPASTVELNLTIDEAKKSISTKSLAKIVASLDDLILVAPPGMGKTATLLQIAEGMLSEEAGIPLFSSLADWATESRDLLVSILHRPAFRGITEDLLRSTAAQGGVVLLLDGWNELDAIARMRAKVQILSLKAEIPNLHLVISTRRQSLDVPIEALRADLLPLTYGQQEAIAREMNGEIGVRVVDRAWRTSGIRELVAIPLYLTVLLSLPKGSAFPGTKEEMLRQFVKVHEAPPYRAEALREVLSGQQQVYLIDLSVQATSALQVAFSEKDARRWIVATGKYLADDGQITAQLAPNVVLDALVSNHVLIRSGDASGYSFQHQQFQEWYSSHWVEDCMRAAPENTSARTTFKNEVLDAPVWEEAILFAVERLAHGDEADREVCAKAIRDAMDVDPMLAAEMIYRSSDSVWAKVGDHVQQFARAWHVSSKVDRALRFMLTSGRPEFLDIVWPLATAENQQTSLRALRNCHRLRPSIFGPGAKDAIAALPKEQRELILTEMTSHSDADGLDLSAALTKIDPDPEVQAMVISVLLFRRADHHVTEILREVTDERLSLILQQNAIDPADIEDPQCRDRVMRTGLSAAKKTDYDQLRQIAFSSVESVSEGEVFELISRMEIDAHRQGVEEAVHRLRSRYPVVIAEALLERVRTGRTLLTGASDIVASAGLAIDDVVLLRIAQEGLGKHDERGAIAASVLGAQSAAVLLAQMLDLQPRLKVSGNWNLEAGDLFHAIESRLALSPIESVVQAVVERSAQATPAQMRVMADLLVRCRGLGSDRDRPFSATLRDTVGGFVEDWGDRMLRSGAATRDETSSIAKLAACAPSVRLLPILQELLDDNLHRLREFRAEAEAAGWRTSPATDEARTPRTHEYSRAFLVIPSPETRRLMIGYLDQELFGDAAAAVLVQQWCLAHEPAHEHPMFGQPQFQEVGDRRAKRTAKPEASCEEADAIFRVVQDLLSDEPSDSKRRLAISLGVRGARLPHGGWQHVVNKLLALAPWSAHRSLLLNLCMSGLVIKLDDVERGIADTIEAAKVHPWILVQSDGYELRQWLQLLPFTDRPVEGLKQVARLLEYFPHGHFLNDLIFACSCAPGDAGANCLYHLAELIPALYGDHSWQRAVFGLAMDSEDAAYGLVDIVVGGAFSNTRVDSWYFVREFAGLLEAHQELRARVYALIKNGPTTRGLTLLAEAVAESPDAPGILLLVRAEKLVKRQFVGHRTLEHVATKQVPSRDWSGAFEVLPAPVAELRRELLSMCEDGGSSDTAARCLRGIDAIRDVHGLPESEPRHPHFASGISWPILSAQSDAEEMY